MNNRRDEIYESITKKQLGILFAAGGFIGAVIFIACYGIDAVNVTNDGWLLKGGDLMQHYVGWKAYRNSAWHFPIGMTDGLIYPDQTCVIFTDSIPLFAIFFKILSPLLPETFQYFGLWGIMTFILMGGIAAVILRKATENLSLCVIGSVFFSFSPYVIQRMYNHTALAGQWLILLAIAIWIYKPYFCNFKRKTIAWGTLLVAASLVHIYYIPMVMIFMIFSCFQDLLENKGWKLDFLMGIIVIAVDLAVLGCVGAFSSTTSMQDEGLGIYSSNLNVFWNPLGKGRLLPRSPIVSIGQDEGYGYLGCGILLLTVCMLIIVILKKVYGYIKQGKIKERSKIRELIKKYSFEISIVLTFSAVVILSVSPTITYDDRVLSVINYPKKIIDLLSVFRASGRFIWCACYTLMFLVIIETIKDIRREQICIVILLSALLLQGVDLGKYALERRESTRSDLELEDLAPERWKTVSEDKKHIVCLPYDIIKNSCGESVVYEMANFAVDHHMTINYYVAARVDKEKIAVNEQKIRKMLSEKKIFKDTLFILDSEETGISYGMKTEIISGIAVGYFEE